MRFFLETRFGGTPAGEEVFCMYWRTHNWRVVLRTTNYRYCPMLTSDRLVRELG